MDGQVEISREIPWKKKRQSEDTNRLTSKVGLYSKSKSHKFENTGIIEHRKQKRIYSLKKLRLHRRCSINNDDGSWRKYIFDMKYSISDSLSPLAIRQAVSIQKVVSSCRHTMVTICCRPLVVSKIFFVAEGRETIPSNDSIVDNGYMHFPWRKIPLNLWPFLYPNS